MQTVVHARIQQRGFTIIELVIVTVILGILLTTAAVSMRSFDTLKLSGATEKLKSDIRYAQRTAMHQQVKCGLKIDIKKNSYYVYIGAPDTKAIDPLNGNDYVVNYDQDGKYRGVVISSTNFGSALYFDPLGIPFDEKDNALSTPGKIVCTMQSGTADVTIEGYTGLVRISMTDLEKEG